MTRARDLSNLMGSGNFSSTTFTATAGQTAFTIAHTQGFVQVFMNGLLLDLTTDYTSNGSAITLTSAAAAGDEIEVVKYNTFSVGDAVPASGGTFTGNVNIPGHVVQVKQVTGSSFATNNSASAYTDLMTLNIIPSSSSNKIMCYVVVAYGGSTNSYHAGRLLRTVSGTSTALRLGNAHFTESRFTDASFGLQMNGLANDQYKVWNTTFNYLDSPSTTSQITYTVGAKADGSYSSRTFFFNRSESNPSDGYNPPPWSSMTLMEISA